MVVNTGGCSPKQIWFFWKKIWMRLIGTLIDKDNFWVLEGEDLEDVTTTWWQLENLAMDQNRIKRCLDGLRSSKRAYQTFERFADVW